jgi:hypothetical protein
LLAGLEYGGHGSIVSCRWPQLRVARHIRQRSFSQLLMRFSAMINVLT